jgi:hypothetical protein
MAVCRSQAHRFLRCLLWGRSGHTPLTIRIHFSVWLWADCMELAKSKVHDTVYNWSRIYCWLYGHKRSRLVTQITSQHRVPANRSDTFVRRQPKRHKVNKESRNTTSVQSTSTFNIILYTKSSRTATLIFPTSLLTNKWLTLRQNPYLATSLKGFALTSLWHRSKTFKPKQIYPPEEKTKLRTSNTHSRSGSTHIYKQWETIFKNPEHTHLTAVGAFLS